MSDFPIKWRQVSHGYGDDGEPIRHRESLVLIYENGAVEAWRSPMGLSCHFPDDYYGGVEIHSKTPTYDGQEPHPMPCQWTGGDCYHDGSSLAFDRIARLFGDHDAVFAELSTWARSNLGVSS